MLTLYSVGVSGFVFFGEEKLFYNFYIKKVFVPCFIVFGLIALEIVFVPVSFLRKYVWFGFVPFYLLGLFWSILGYKNIITEIKEKFKK